MKDDFQGQEKSCELSAGSGSLPAGITATSECADVRELFVANESRAPTWERRGRGDSSLSSPIIESKDIDVWRTG